MLSEEIIFESTSKIVLLPTIIEPSCLKISPKTTSILQSLSEIGNVNFFLGHKRVLIITIPTIRKIHQKDFIVFDIGSLKKDEISTDNHRAPKTRRISEIIISSFLAILNT